MLGLRRRKNVIGREENKEVGSLNLKDIDESYGLTFKFLLSPKHQCDLDIRSFINSS